MKVGDSFNLWRIAVDSRQDVVLHLGFVCFLESVIHFIFINKQTFRNRNIFRLQMRELGCCSWTEPVRSRCCDSVRWWRTEFKNPAPLHATRDLTIDTTCGICFRIIDILLFQPDDFIPHSHILLIITFAVFYHLYLSFTGNLFPLGHPAGSEGLLSFDLSNLSVIINVNWPSSQCGLTPPSPHVGSIPVGQL